MKRFIIFVSILILLALSSISVIACSCITLPLDSAINESENIAILKLKSIEKYQDDEKGYGYGGIKKVTFVVQKVYKGEFQVEQELDFSQGGGADCIFAFSEESIGIEMLFFLDSNDFQNGLWAAFICSRSGNIKSVTGDLMYLEKYEQVKDKNRLSGTLLQEIESNDKRKQRYKPLTKEKVKITGKGMKITVVTDENGVYEVYDLPAGNYVVIPPKIKGYKIDSDSQDGSEKIEIGKNDLEEQNFLFSR